MRTHIASIVLAGAVLTAASFLAPFARAATGPYLMPPGAPFDPNPALPGSPTRAFMTYGVDSDGNTIPLKTLRISNNTAQTVYPIIRDPNSTTLAAPDTTIGLYDPYDPVSNEYRGYVGYTEGGKYYFGLQAGQSILLSIPLVFWDSGRISVGTDGKYLTPGKNDPNPLGWNAEAKLSITSAQPSGDTIKNGVVMWYRSDIPLGPTPDTEDQLAEWTVRDHDYLVNPGITRKTKSQIPDNQLVTLMNYDVSNVDNIYLPLGMEANDVWVIPQVTGPNGNRDSWKPGSDPDVYGWTGAINTIDFLQGGISEFTDPNNQLLGQYFGKTMEGWPFYNIPATNFKNAPIKIPGGANIFAQSPIIGVASSYVTPDWKTNKYMLSSGGTEAIFAAIGWAGGTPDKPGSYIVHLTLNEPDKIAFLQKGDFVTSSLNKDKIDPIQAGTTVDSVDAMAGTVMLSKQLVGSSEDCTFTFTRPVDDYASDALIRLWYSWAQYYRIHWKDNMPSAPDSTEIQGSIDQKTATLTFNEAHPELIEGMAVKGPGLDDAQTEVGPHQGDAVILQIAPDKKSVIVSQVVATGSQNAMFTFLAPKSLYYTPTAATDPGYGLFGDKFQFTNEPDFHNPYKFSQVVYLIMASMNQIGQPNNNNVCKYMEDIIGANMGYIFTNDAKQTYDANMVTSMIRDMIKSVLRGVTDFTLFPDLIDSKGNHTVWYPDPKVPDGGQMFNVFNLDPFVRFVHVVLGFSGYGFSVDDDTADVGAGGASELQLSVTGTGGLMKTVQWTIQAPYGPVTPKVTLDYSGPATTTNGDTLYNAIASVSNTTPIKVGTPVPHRLSNGDKVRIDQVMGDPAANGSFTVENVTRDTFELFDFNTGKIPVAPMGTYTGGGRWSYPLHPYIDSGSDLTLVFYRVTGDDALGTFLGTSVSVNGVVKNPVMPKDPPFRVWQLGQESTGRLLLWKDLTDQYGNLLPKGKYNFTFFGPVENSPKP